MWAHHIQLYTHFQLLKVDETAKTAPIQSILLRFAREASSYGLNGVKQGQQPIFLHAVHPESLDADLGPHILGEGFSVRV